MATYQDIKGLRVKYLSADPGTLRAGEVWYNSVSNTLKGVVSFAAWSSGSPLSTGRLQAAAGGTQTALWFASGALPSGYPSAFTVTEEYNGSGWTTGGACTARISGGGSGTLTAGLFSGGGLGGPTVTTTEEYDGSNWTASPALNTAREGLGTGGTQTATVVFGGRSPGYTGATEEYDGSSWTTSPGSLSTVRDLAQGLGAGTQTAALAFGGYIGNGRQTMTEEYGGTTWTTGGALTTGRYGGAGWGLQTDAVAASGAPPGATETYDGSAWATSPATIANGPLGYRSGNSDTDSSAGIIAGGPGPAGSTATEEFNKSINTITAAAWASGGVYPVNPVTDFSAAGTQTAAIAFGGFPSRDVSATYNGSSWTAGPSLNTGRSLSASAKNGTTTAALCTGGELPGSNKSDKCESFDGSSWTEGPNYPTTAQFGDQGVGIQTAALVSGGYGGSPGTEYIATTCTYDGSTWTALGTPSNLSAGAFAGTATGTSTAAIMFSGTGRPGLIESWDGSTWSEQAEALTARGGAGSAGTSTDALYFGGEPGPTATAVTEHWNGTSFSTRPSLGTATRQFASSGTATAALAIGGSGGAGNLTEEYTGETSVATASTLTTS